MVKYKPVEFDVFPPKILSDNQVNRLYTFSKMSQRIIDETRGFICGNPTCRYETVINEKVAWIPRRCLVCGEEFDWENILIETKNIVHYVMKYIQIMLIFVHFIMIRK